MVTGKQSNSRVIELLRDVRNFFLLRFFNTTLLDVESMSVNHFYSSNTSCGGMSVFLPLMVERSHDQLI